LLTLFFFENNTVDRLNINRQNQILHNEECFVDDNNKRSSSTLPHVFRMVRSMMPIIVPTSTTISNSIDYYATMVSVIADLNKAIKKAKLFPHVSRRQRAKNACTNAFRNFIIRNSTLHINND
jgi:hypothetical protein